MSLPNLALAETVPDAEIPINWLVSLTYCHFSLESNHSILFYIHSVLCFPLSLIWSIWKTRVQMRVAMVGISPFLASRSQCGNDSFALQSPRITNHIL